MHKIILYIFVVYKKGANSAKGGVPPLPFVLKDNNYVLYLQ